MLYIICYILYIRYHTLYIIYYISYIIYYRLYIICYLLYNIYIYIYSIYHILYIIYYIVYIICYILYIIRHRAARHARACSRQLSAVCCLLSDFPSFKGTFAPHPFLVASLVLHTFCIIFSSLIFCENWCQKVSKWEPQNNPKSQKSTKSRHQNASAIKACKKTLSGRGQTSEIEHSSTLLTLFTKAKGSQK